MTDKPSQSDRFVKVARDLGCDEDETRWDDTVRKIAAHKPTAPATDEPNE